MLFQQCLDKWQKKLKKKKKIGVMGLYNLNVLYYG